MLSALSIREIIPVRSGKDLIQKIPQSSTRKGKKARRKNGGEEFCFLRYNAM